VWEVVAELLRSAALNVAARDGGFVVHFLTIPF